MSGIDRGVDDFAEGRPRVRVEIEPQILDRVLHVLDAGAGRARDLWEAVHAEVLEVLLDDRPSERRAVRNAVELQQEAFLQAAGADARGVEALDDQERFLDVVELAFTLFGELFERRDEAAIGIERVDDHLAPLEQFVVEIEEVQLRDEVLGQRLAPTWRVGQGLHLGVGVLGAAASPEPAEFALTLVELLERLEARLEVAEVVLLLGRFLCRALGLDDVQEDVLLQLLVDAVLQLQQRILENLHGLDHLRRLDLSLLDAEVLG